MSTTWGQVEAAQRDDDPVREAIGDLVANTGDLERAKAALLTVLDLVDQIGAGNSNVTDEQKIAREVANGFRAVVAFHLGVGED